MQTEKQITEGKKIEDYLHLYMKSPAIVDGGRTKLTAYHIEFQDEGTIKPILRPLSEMTEQDGKEIAMLYFKDCDVSKVKFEITKYSNNPAVQYCDARLTFHENTPEVTRYLLSKHFDIFNLHESGLCLYESDLKTSK